MPIIEFGTPDITSSFKDFENIANIVIQLFNDDKIKILFGFETDIRIEIDDLALSKFEVDKDTFNKILSNEIIPILEAILSGSEEELVNIQLAPLKIKSKKDSHNEEEYESRRIGIKNKIDYIKKFLVNDELVNRYLIKATTKLPKIKELQWEINQKIYDSSAKKEISTKYATINIKVSKELTNTDFLFKFLPFMQAEYKIDEISFDCDKYDIDMIIDILENIKAKLT